MHRETETDADETVIQWTRAGRDNQRNDILIARKVDADINAGVVDGASA